MIPAKQSRKLRTPQRWVKELKELQQDPPKEFQIVNLDEALQGQIALILLHGPPNTPYQGYSFMLEYDQLEIPYKPPIVKFKDIPWSPFVDEKTGRVCCDILIDQWSPALGLRTAMLSLCSLLGETKMPEGEIGLNIEAAAEMNASYEVFRDHAKQFASSHHFIEKVNYVDQQKPPCFYEKQPNLSDVELQQMKHSFMESPENIQKHNKKIKKMQKRIVKGQHKINKQEKQDDELQVEFDQIKRFYPKDPSDHDQQL